VLTELLARRPGDIDVADLHLRGPIGSPLGPLSIALSLSMRSPGGAVFWNPGFVPPLWSSCPSVVTVHDLAHRHFYGYLRSKYYDLVLERLFRRCSRIVCVSEFTRSEFLSWSAIDPAKVEVIPNAVSGEFVENRSKARLGFDYVLYAGNHRPYKNLARLIEAYALSRLPGSNVLLVLTGNPNEDLVAVAERCAVARFVRFTGHLAPSAVPALYRGASAVAFVSLYEGFGLPILEGMASEVPVITSRTSAMPEVAGDAAMLVDPLDAHAIADALDRVVGDQDLRSDLVRRGLKNLERFDWTRSAHRLWNLIRSVRRDANG
jgi:glycosyltransferase involved in cell wall biosynthesis